MEFDKIEPIGGQRGDWHAAAVTSALLNISAAQSGSRKRVRVRDCKLEYKDPLDVIEPVQGTKEASPAEAPAPADGDGRPRQTWQEQKMIAMMWSAALSAPTRKKFKKKTNG